MNPHTMRDFLSSPVRLIAYGIGTVVIALFLLYTLAYVFGTFFALTSGRIIADYPAALTSALANKNRSYLPYGAIPSCAIDGTISVEDKRFFYTPGIDPLALVRVSFEGLRNDHQDHGGSTITQQLARRIIGESRNYSSLLAELWSELRVIKYSLVVEHDFSKEKILELYLNSIYYGRGAQGIAQAALTYFHTDITQLSTADCYYLTGLPQAPSYFGSDAQAAIERYLHVLGTLRRNGYITSAEEQVLASSTPGVAASEL